MNDDFLRIIAASPEDRRGLFLVTANRLGTPNQNVEKDFWVSWVLDLLFSGRDTGEPRLLFKGGTSLSKAYGLISRSRCSGRALAWTSRRVIWKDSLASSNDFA